MRLCISFVLTAAALAAQTPPPFTADTVIGTVDGKKMTFGDLRRMIEAAPAGLFQAFQQNPMEAISRVYMMRYLAAEGEKRKLEQQSPWKEQLELQRQNIVATAMTTEERNTYQVSEEAVEKYYKEHQARYEQVKIKVIMVAFQPGASAAGTSAADVKAAAERAVEAAHAGSTRSEADARKLSADVVKKLRAGANFAAMLIYSDDQESKNAGGDFGVVKYNSNYRDDFKNAVFALKEGQVSDPILSGAAFYIVRAEKKTLQPVDEVREPIMQQLKDDHIREFIATLQARFAPKIDRPELLMQAIPRPAARK